MNAIYPAIFTETNDKKNPILVYIPDINRMTEGKNIADAIAIGHSQINESKDEGMIIWD